MKKRDTTAAVSAAVTARATHTAAELAAVHGGSGSNTVFVPRRNGETGILIAA